MIKIELFLTGQQRCSSGMKNINVVDAGSVDTSVY
jgi:hypothetical protein